MPCISSERSPRTSIISSVQETHLALGKDCPAPRAVLAQGKIIWIPFLGGLHHCISALLHGAIRRRDCGEPQLTLRFQHVDQGTSMRDSREFLSVKRDRDISNWRFALSVLPSFW